MGRTLRVLGREGKVSVRCLKESLQYIIFYNEYIGSVIGMGEC